MELKSKHENLNVVLMFTKSAVEVFGGGSMDETKMRDLTVWHIQVLCYKSLFKTMILSTFIQKKQKTCLYHDTIHSDLSDHHHSQDDAPFLSFSAEIKILLSTKTSFICKGETRNEMC